MAQPYFGAAGAGEGTLLASPGTLRRFRVATTSQPGTWQSEAMVFPSLNPGQVVTFQVRVWDVTQAATYAQAEQRNRVRGVSATWRRTVAAPTDLLGR